MKQQQNATGTRASVTVIESRLDAGRGIHFCSHPVLSGGDSNLWFPVGLCDTLFEAVERAMVMNHQANNVVKITPVREHDSGRDWEVVYNVSVGG